MAKKVHAEWRRALTEISNRRTIVGASVLGMASLLNAVPHADARKGKKRKKRCKNGAKRCGKGCCKSPSICSAASCFCTGNEGNCKSIPDELIKLIAEALGIPPEQLKGDPDLLPTECPTIQPKVKEEINTSIETDFGVIGEVPWCEGGIEAAAAALHEKLTIKA